MQHKAIKSLICVVGYQAIQITWAIKRFTGTLGDEMLGSFLGSSDVA